MPSHRKFLIAAAALAAVATAACGDTTSSQSGGQAPLASETPVATCVTGSISADGSSAIKALVQKAADQYMASCPGSTITVAATNSSTGVTKAASGAVNIGDSDVPAGLVQGVDATSIVDHPVAIVLFDVAVSSDVPVSNLTAQQVRAIFSGKITNWNAVGGPDKAIAVYERKPGSGTRFTFDKDMMQGTPETSQAAGAIDTTQSLVQNMQQTPGSISYLTDSSVKSSTGIKALAIDGVAPSAATVANGTYPFFSHEHCFTKPHPSLLTLSFLQYIQSSQFQSGTLTQLGYLPLSTTTRKAAVDG